jgi:flagellar hook-associated protein 3 FlgL
MSIDRVSTANQMQLMMGRIAQTETQLNQSQQQVATGTVATDYAGYGSKVDALEAARAAAAKATAYQDATNAAVTQVNLQDTQLTALANLSQQLSQAISDAAGKNDASGLMATAQSVFQSATQILNSTDANGNYIYGGENDNNPPVTITQLSDLALVPSASSVFANSAQTKSVMVGDGESMNVGVTASSVATGLMQTLKDLVDFNNSPSGNFQTTLTSAQSNFLSSEMAPAQAATNTVNEAAGANGNVYKALQDAANQQQSMAQLYQGFVSDIQNVDMGQAISNLNLNQTALQAALQVTAQLNKVSLLNFL